MDFKTRQARYLKNNSPPRGAEAFLYGNKIVWDEEIQWWRVQQSGKILDVEIGRRNLVCPKCDMTPTDEGCDPCMGLLPGVKFACCGHGVEEGYVYFDREDRVTIRGNFTAYKQSNDT